MMETVRSHVTPRTNRLNEICLHLTDTRSLTFDEEKMAVAVLVVFQLSDSERRYLDINHLKEEDIIGIGKSDFLSRKGFSRQLPRANLEETT